MKKCFKCGQAKELDCFYKHGQMGDGHFNKCIECAKRDANDHRLKNLERIRAYDRERGRLPHRLKANRLRNRIGDKKTNNKKWYLEHKAKILEKQRIWRKNNRLQYCARGMLDNAVRDKRIIKPEICSVCGDKTKLHGHHEDYYKPLDVIWVCVSCHGKLHRKYKD